MKVFWMVVKIVALGILVIAAARTVVNLRLAAHQARVEQDALLAKARANQTVLPRERIYSHREVGIREMPEGSRGWTAADAILVDKGGRCFLDLAGRVELNAKPNHPEVELRRLKDGTCQAIVLDRSIRWEPLDIAGSEKDSFGQLLYFPLHVSFSASQKADAR